MIPTPVHPHAKPQSKVSLHEAHSIKQEVTTNSVEISKSLVGKSYVPTPIPQPTPEVSKVNTPKGAVRNSEVKPKKKAGAESGRNYSKEYSKEEVKALIVQYSEQYGINPEVPLCIAKYESGFNHLAKNKSSSASGTFQYLSGTWKGTDEGKAGYSVFDAEMNVKAAVKYMASRKSTAPWEVRNRCPKL